MTYLALTAASATLVLGMISMTRETAALDDALAELGDGFELAARPPEETNLLHHVHVTGNEGREKLGRVDTTAPRVCCNPIDRPRPALQLPKPNRAPGQTRTKPAGAARSQMPPRRSALPHYP